MAVILLTLEDMLNAFGRLVGEPTASNSRWDQATRIAWINEGQLDFVEQTRCLEELFSSSVTAWASAGDEILTLPNNLFDDGILEIYWKDSSDDYHPLTETHPRFATIQNDDTGDPPTEFFRIGRNIHLKPKPSAAGSVVIVGQKMPDELVATSLTGQSLIPAQFRKGPVHYAVMQAWAEDDEYSKYSIHEKIYEQTMRRAKKYAKKMRSKRTPQMKMPHTIRMDHHYHQ